MRTSLVFLKELTTLPVDFFPQRFFSSFQNDKKNQGIIQCNAGKTIRKEKGDNLQKKQITKRSNKLKQQAGAELGQAQQQLAQVDQKF